MASEMESTPGTVKVKGAKVTGYVEVKCSKCGDSKKVGPGEVGPGDFPMCEQCCLPMMPVLASNR